MLPPPWGLTPASPGPVPDRATHSTGPRSPPAPGGSTEAEAHGRWSRSRPGPSPGPAPATVRPRALSYPSASASSPARRLPRVTGLPRAGTHPSDRLRPARGPQSPPSGRRGDSPRAGACLCQALCVLGGKIKCPSQAPPAPCLLPPSANTLDPTSITAWFSNYVRFLKLHALISLYFTELKFPAYNLSGYNFSLNVTLLKSLCAVSLPSSASIARSIVTRLRPALRPLTTHGVWLVSRVFCHRWCRCEHANVCPQVLAGENSLGRSVERST